MIKTGKNRFTLIVLCLLAFCGLLVLHPPFMQKLSGFGAYNTYMSSTLQSESQAYITYRQFTTNIQNNDKKQIYAEYPVASKKWVAEIRAAQKMYNTYTQPFSNIKMKKLSQKSLMGTQKVLEATKLYDTVFVESDIPAEKLTENLTKADALMNEAILSHDSVIDLFNTQTKKSYKLVYNVAISAIVAGIFSLLFFVLSLKKSTDSHNIMRAHILKSLASGSFLMFVGLLITYGGLRQALTKGGGEYAMLYVPFFIGISAFIYSVYSYWTKDRLVSHEKENGK